MIYEKFYKKSIGKHLGAFNEKVHEFLKERDKGSLKNEILEEKVCIGHY